MQKVEDTVLKLFVGAILFAVLAFVVALPTMWLWDWLMPKLFGLREITFEQALGVNLLCGILFKSSK